MSEQSDFFLYPNNRYYGAFQPNHLAFNSNLQEFTQKISYTAVRRHMGDACNPLPLSE